jgi:uncharacterized protein YjbI with pentapeptide repeats
MNQKELSTTLQDHRDWVHNRHASGKKADLRGADLRKVNFEGADLRFADLRAADLSGSNLSQADMSNADLRGANLSEAVCISTKFVNARLEGPNLYGVDLRTAVMEYSQMAAVNMTSRFQNILKDKPRTEEKRHQQNQTHEQKQSQQNERAGR